MEPLRLVTGVLNDLDIHFQGQTFSCYAFATKNAHAADVLDRFAWTLTARRGVAFVILRFL